MSRLLWCGIALVLASIALGLITGSLSGFDRPVLTALAMTQARSPGWAIAVTQAMTWLGNPGTRGIFVTLLLCALIYRRSWRSATAFLVTVALSIAGHSVMKEMFARARPTLVPWLNHADTYAYPSGHAAGTMVILLLGSLLVGDRRLVWVALAISIAIGLSRVALGVHWPSDVIGGWAYGGGMALIGYAVTGQVERPKGKRAS